MAAGNAGMSAAATAASSDGSSSSSTRFASMHALVPTIVAILVAFVFFRSVLPRIPRLFLRGRLRVRRAGLRGIRGIEWNGNGFAAIAKKGTAAATSEADGNSRLGSSNKVATGGLIVKIRHIYFTFQRQKTQDGVAADRRRRSQGSEGSEQNDDDDDELHTSSGRAWLTLHVDGVGITLPPEDEAARKKKADRAEAKRREAERAQKEREEAHELRLQKLMQEEPVSPRLGGIGRPLSPLFGASSLARPLSPLFGGGAGRPNGARPNMATMSMAAQESIDPHHSEEPKPQHSIQKPASEQVSELLRAALNIARFQVLPAIIYCITRAITAAASSLASLLPFMTSIVDLEIHRVEIYSADVDIVFRAKRISFGAHVDVLKDTADVRSQQSAQPDAKTSHACATLRDRLSLRLVSVQQRLGKGATDAASLIRERLPAVRVSLQVSTEGIQAFDAAWARARVAEQNGHRERKSQDGKWLSDTVPDAPPSPPRAHASIHAAHERDWRSFSDVAESDSGRPKLHFRRSLLQRMASDDGVSSMPEGARSSRWTGTWADWTLESRPNANFVSSTPWARDVTACHSKPISPSARLLAITTESTIRLGVGLGKAISRESLHLAIGVAPLMLSADSFGRIQERLHRAKQRREADYERQDEDASKKADTKPPPEALVRILEMLSTVSVHVPSVKVDLSTKSSAASIISSSTGTSRLQGELPSSIQLSAELSDLFLNLKNSDVNDGLHLHWLGACGIKGYRDRRYSRAFPTNLRWPGGAQQKSLVEHRRVYSIDCGIKSILAHLGTDGESRRTQSKLLQAEGLKCQARSSWTPIGLISATRSSEAAAEHFFRSDPNEAAVIVETRAESITGNLKAEHLASLLSFIKSKDAASSPKPAKQDHQQPKTLSYIPRIAYYGELADLSYRMDTTDLTADSSFTSGDMPSMQPLPETSLNIRIPNVRFNVRNTYSDVLPRRSDQERRQAWKALEKGRLEWSLAPTHGAVDQPRTPMDDDETLQGSNEDTGSGDATIMDQGKETGEEDVHALTMAEAIREMQRIQKQGKPQSKRPQHAKRRQSHEDPGFLPNLSARLEAECSFDVCKVFWLMPQKEGAMHHAKDDNDMDVLSTSRVGLAEVEQEVVDVMQLNTLSLSGKMTMPAVQDATSDAISLYPSRASFDTHASLEGFDLELWQTSALQALNALLTSLKSTAHAQVAPDLQTAHPQSENGKAGNEEVEETYLFDYLNCELSVYISIGAFCAHIAGIDKRCDDSTSRGVGIDIKRAIVQLVSIPRERRGSADAMRLLFGSRSALSLPEDLRSSVAAMVLRQGKAASFKVDFHNLGVFPLLDAETAAEEHHANKEGRPPKEKPTAANAASEPPGSPSIIAPAVWEFQKTRPERSDSHRKHRKWRQQDRNNFMISIPNLALRANLTAKPYAGGPTARTREEVHIFGEDLRLLSFKIELLHTYCLLNAFASMRRVFSKSATIPKSSPPHLPASPPFQGAQKAPKKKRLVKPHITATVHFADTHMDVTLPNDVKVFILLQRLEFSYTPVNGPRIGFEWLMAAVESAEESSKGCWEELARIRDCNVYLGKDDASGRVKVDVNADGLNFRVPFGYLVYPIIDNTVVAVKATKQLLLQFIKDSNESFITPVAEDPKHLPVVDLHVRTFAIEAQDDPFETRLNIIWRSGGDENQARAERDVAFEEKLQKLEQMRRRNGSQASFSSATEGTTSGEEEARANVQAVAAEEARRRLDMFNASSWIRRFTNARAEQARREEATKRRIYGRLPIRLDKHSKLPINLLPRATVSPLFRSTISRFRLQIAPTTFPESEVRDFLHEQGKGMPKKMDYSLIIPMHVRIEMGEWRVELRDYPMPLLHFPPVDHSKQSDHLPGLEVAFDCVIAEQLGGKEALRHVPAVIVPAATGKPEAIEYGISVPRMAMPTKFFGSPVITVNSSYTSRFVWGQSIQPAISDCVRILEGITTPPQDPSPRIGFWDKLSLIIHGRVLFRFPNDGQFHLYLKGSREPYHILGHGAGWVKCWRGNVEIRIGFPNKDNEVVQILSDEYLLAIPELKDYIDRAATGTENQSNDEPDNHRQTRHAREAMAHRSNGHDQPLTHHYGYAKEPEYKKVCLKLTNGVRWGSALILEHTCTDESCVQSKKCSGQPFYRKCRFWSRKKHWEVYQRSKDYVSTLPENEKGDSYEGWRSHHLHFSISVTSPVEREGLVKRTLKRLDTSPKDTNNFYFTPLAWEHFWAWMRLFDSALGLPIRQGKLFPGSLEQSPKFGKHLGTIKYRFDLAPLFISHVYPQDSKLDWARGRKSLLGIKARMDIFHLDFHQRQQEMLMDRPELGGWRKKFHKPFYEAEVDLSEINFRTVAARFNEPDKRLMTMDEYDGEEEEDDQENVFGDQGGEILADMDNEWYDLQDFVELDWAPRDTGREPHIKMMEAMTCPRFNYYRRIESKHERVERLEGSASAEEIENLERSKFGKEETHTCLVNKASNPPLIQKDISRQRLNVLQSELDQLTSGDTAAADAIRKRMRLIEDYIGMLDKAEALLEESMQPGGESASFTEDKDGDDHPQNLEQSPQYSREVVKEWQAFENRYFIHNPIVFYNNATRDVLLKYYLSSRKRRAIVHSLSARAVRYIKNLGLEDEEHGHRPGDAQSQSESMKRSRSRSTASGSEASAKVQASREHGIDVEAPKVLKDLLKETMAHMSNMPHRKKQPVLPVESDGPDPSGGISDEYDVTKSNVCILVKPQLVLKSLVNENSTVIITATRTRMHNYSVIDPHMEEDSVNHRVLHRNYIGVDGLQAFQPTSSCQYLNQAKERNGFIHVPLETLVDLRHSTTDFDRIAPRTDAHIQYDKFNKLRLNDPHRPLSNTRVSEKDEGTETRDAGENDHLCHTMDLIRLQCPRYSVSANADQFAAIYNIVTDLLLYRDPAYREHAKKLETMMLSHDYGDVLTLADVVQALQIRIRHARELHAQYHLHFAHLNEQGRLDFLSLKAEINDMQDELNLLLEAITASDDSSDKEKKLALRIDAQAEDIGWNMMGDQGTDLLAKLNIRGVSFTWLNKADNSVANTLSIKDMYALNVHPEAVFAEIITKYNKAEDHPMKKKGMLVNAMWSVLAPVGGIGIVDHFELHLHPLKIQLEHRIGKQIEEYIFGSVRDKKRRKEQDDGKKIENGHDSESSDAPSASQGQMRKVSSPLRRLAIAVRGGHRNTESQDKQIALRRNAKSTESLRPDPVRRTSSGGRSFSSRDDGRKGSDQNKSLTQKRSNLNLNGTGNESWTARSGTPTTERGNYGYGQDDEDEDESSFDDDTNSDDHEQQSIAARNAIEMRERASRTVTFVYFKFSETVLCLSYKAEKQRSITDLYDLVFKSPRLEYINRTWAHADLVSHIKKDIFRSAWSQKSTLLKSVINQRRPAQQRVAAAALSLTRSRQGSSSLSQSDSNIANPVDRAMLAAQEAMKKASQEDEASSSPRFSLYVDPPTQDRDIDQPHDQESDHESGDFASSEREADSSFDDREVDSRQSSQRITRSESKTPRHSTQTERDNAYHGGDDLGGRASYTGSNTSSNRTASPSAHGSAEASSQRSLGRILAKTLHRNKESRQSSELPNSARNGVNGHDSHGEGYEHASQLPEANQTGLSKQKSISTTPLISHQTSRGSLEQSASPSSSPRQQQRGWRGRDRTSSAGFGFDQVLGSVRRARDRLSSAPQNEGSGNDAQV